MVPWSWESMLFFTVDFQLGQIYCKEQWAVINENVNNLQKTAAQH